MHKQSQRCLLLCFSLVSTWFCRSTVLEQLEQRAILPQQTNLWQLRLRSPLVTFEPLQLPFIYQFKIFSFKTLKSFIKPFFQDTTQQFAIAQKPKHNAGQALHWKIVVGKEMEARSKENLKSTITETKLPGFDKHIKAVLEGSRRFE